MVLEDSPMTMALRNTLAVGRGLHSCVHEYEGNASKCRSNARVQGSTKMSRHFGITCGALKCAKSFGRKKNCLMDS